MRNHGALVRAVHAEGTRICLQILHAGRYARHRRAVAPSALQAPINLFKPAALTADQIERQIFDFVRCARLARQAGYDGVEIMGSEGYLINQFIAPRTNQRTDAWGGGCEQRMRFALAIVERIRAATGPTFIIIFRLSMLDLVEQGSTWEEIALLARRLEQAGVSLINTGIGWHEARVPTIAATRAPGRLCLGHGPAQGQRGRAADCQQPHQHARNGRSGVGRRPGRSGLPGPAPAGRPGFHRQGGHRTGTS